MSEETNFKVTDRRLFNADGSPRELSPEERTPAKPIPEPQEPPTAAAVPEMSVEPTATAQTPSSPEDDEIELPHDADDPASFANFLMSIASNAASSLGMMEHPVTRKREVDLELGKHWIDVLGMLQQKTRGNLSPQEQQILEGLLADLRMQFVSLANSATQPKTRGFTSGDITGGR
ncbi:MAG TPA: DUF1844 domain-containing protein [Pyrinomonadaceae bacterium]|nr:DUF1844 domain-containing protein [Pyrinomonadaceae bacterium]